MVLVFKLIFQFAVSFSQHYCTVTSVSKTYTWILSAVQLVYSYHHHHQFFGGERIIQKEKKEKEKKGPTLLLYVSGGESVYWLPIGCWP